MRTFLVRFQLMAFLGAVVAGYLLYHHTEIKFGYSEGPSFCSVSEAFDCDAVAKSSYSELFGIPIATYGLLYYIFFFCVVTGARSRLSEPLDDAVHASIERRARSLLLFLAVLTLPPTIFLFGVSELVIGTLCLMCCILYVVNFLLVGLAYFAPAPKTGLMADLGQGAAELFRRHDESLPLLSTRAWVATAVVLIGLIPLLYRGPSMLVGLHFEPARLSRYDEKTIQPYVDGWKSEPVVALTVSSGSPVEKDFFVGSPDAPVTIIEFSDFECPFCKRFAASFKPWVLKNEQVARLVFKNFPLDTSCNPGMQKSKHELACRAAAMARCAGVQGDDKFWKMHDGLFALPWLSDDGLALLPQRIGLNEQQFAACMSGDVAMNRVRKDVEEGAKANVQGTPTFFVNGRKVQVPESLLPAVILAIAREVKKGQ